MLNGLYPLKVRLNVNLNYICGSSQWLSLRSQIEVRVRRRSLQLDNLLLGGHVFVLFILGVDWHTPIGGHTPIGYGNAFFILFDDMFCSRIINL